MHPKAQITEKAGRNPGSVVYGIPVMLDDGRTATLRGGSRLIVAMQDALRGKTDVVKVRVTPHGAAGTTERKWTITVL